MRPQVLGAAERSLIAKGKEVSEENLGFPLRLIGEISEVQP
jgi:hypothetical protein